MPLPQILHMTMTATAISATHQFEVQLLIAEPDRVRPMAMMMGPVTTGGKNSRTLFTPKALNRPASRK